MEKLKEKFKSVRFRLFYTLCISVVFLMACLIIINNVVLETYYTYSKTGKVKEIYTRINDYYNSPDPLTDVEESVKTLAAQNDIDILIKTDISTMVYTNDKSFLKEIVEIENIQFSRDYTILFAQKNMVIRQIKEENNVSYIMLDAVLDNGYTLYIRIPVSSIQEAVLISNRLLFLIGIFMILLAAIIASVISKKFTSPILELNNIAKKMANLDFSQKYEPTNTEDEVNELGNNINKMSEKLENTIKQLRVNNSELERDIERKSKIDDMRKQFISDVSHELKTPIALIQGYAEGLLDEVNENPEERKFYAEVILDESNKMDELVKKLLELMKLEYDERKFQNEDFNISDLIKEAVKRCTVMIEEAKVQVEFKMDEDITVYADSFYIDQVITNYLTNAIKNVEAIDGEKKIEIGIKKSKKKGKVRVFVFNTGKIIPEDSLDRIWGRFYKLDTSRNRQKGGSGIGLALVRAIMNNYGNDYGVINKENGVEFFFDLDKDKENSQKEE